VSLVGGGLATVVGQVLEPCHLALAEDPAPGSPRVTTRVLPGLTKGSAAFAVLNGGPRVYISGQAEQDADLGKATRETLRSLGDSLRTLGLGREHVAQIKAFLDAVESGGPSPVPAEDGLLALEVALAAVESLRTRRVVHLTGSKEAAR